MLKDCVDAIKNRMDEMDSVLMKNKTEFNNIMVDLSNNIKSEFQIFLNKFEVICDQIKNINYRLDSIERYNRRNHLIISGVPEQIDLSEKHMVLNICAAIKFESNDSTFKHIYRVKRKHNTSSSIVVIFSSLNHKIGFIAKYKEFANLKLSDIGMNLDTRVYCNDGLTARNSLIFYKARLLLHSKQISRVFTRRGQVFISELNSSVAVLVHDVSQLKNFIDNNNSKQQSKDINPAIEPVIAGHVSTVASRVRSRKLSKR